jgi:hypothetical protein
MMVVFIEFFSAAKSRRIALGRELGMRGSYGNETQLCRPVQWRTDRNQSIEKGITLAM